MNVHYFQPRTPDVAVLPASLENQLDKSLDAPRRPSEKCTVLRLDLIQVEIWILRLQDKDLDIYIFPQIPFGASLELPVVIAIGFIYRGDVTSYGWCFLENIEDPTDLTKNCYLDALWSPTHGRFWSHRVILHLDILIILINLVWRAFYIA